MQWAEPVQKLRFYIGIFIQVFFCARYERYLNRL